MKMTSCDTENAFEVILFRKGGEQAKYRLGERMRDVSFWRGEIEQELLALRYNRTGSAGTQVE
jgi:hypothetical protein